MGGACRAFKCMIMGFAKRHINPLRPYSLNTKTTTRSGGDPKSDARKARTAADALGQVFTPAYLATAMVEGLKIPSHAVGMRLLDPCVGPATFPKALDESIHRNLAVEAFDIDPNMVELSKRWGQKSPIKMDVQLVDYLLAPAPPPYDFAILNPPYLRQEWIYNKATYREEFAARYGIHVPGTANLYVYFLVKSILELKIGGRLACILYDSWQSTLYGKWLQDFLELSCSEIAVHPISNLPFEGRLIDATIIYCTRNVGGTERSKFIETTFFSDSIKGLASIESIFHTKRGLRLKQAAFFMSNTNQTDFDGGTPFIKKINLVEGFRVSESHPETALLLSSNNKDKRVERELHTRLELALSNPENNIPILTWYRERPAVWHLHTAPPYAPLLFNYYIRNRPRHIYNESRAYSDNFYGSTPRNTKISVFAWLASMNSTLSSIGLMERARNQGGGLAKLQLFEYRSARVVDLESWEKKDILRMEKLGIELTRSTSSKDIVKKIDQLIYTVYEQKNLHPIALSIQLDTVSTRSKNPK